MISPRVLGGLRKMMKIDISSFIQLVTSLLVFFVGYKINRIDHRRRKHDEQMAQYLFNLTSCLVVTVDSVAELADEISDNQNSEHIKTTLKNIKQAKRELGAFQQKLAAEHIVRSHC